MCAAAVIAWRFTPDDVARIRFAFSPLWEVVLSLVVLRAPAEHTLHLPWVRSARRRVTALDLTELFALVPVRGIVADFLTPPPSSPLPDFAGELDLVRQTPRQQIIDDVADVPQVPAQVGDRIRDDPQGAVERIAQSLQAYWDLVLVDVWPRMSALLEADVLWRARRLTTGGAQALFDDLHDTVSWHDGQLVASDPWDYSGSLSGEGLLLIPSAMAWPTVRKMVAPYQPAIAYPARGIATLWENGAPPSSESLSALIGRTRAGLLAALDGPHSTTTLAKRFAVTPGAVSQHLSVLRASGLVTGSRVGGSVLYRRTPRGDTLVGCD